MRELWEMTMEEAAGKDKFPRIKKEDERLLWWKDLSPAEEEMKRYILSGMEMKLVKRLFSDMKTKDFMRTYNKVDYICKTYLT